VIGWIRWWTQPEQGTPVMDATRAIWHNQAVRAAVESGDLGAIVRAVRQANQL
jgi:hypothetical protein